MIPIILLPILVVNGVFWTLLIRWYRNYLEPEYNQIIQGPGPLTFFDYLLVLNYEFIPRTLVIVLVTSSAVIMDEFGLLESTNSTFIHPHYHFTGYNKIKMPPSDGQVYGFDISPETRKNDDNPFGIRSRKN